MARDTLDGNTARMQALLGEMGDAVVAAFRAACAALLDRHPRLAERVIEGDPAIDDLRARIEVLATETITIFAPVGPDMRVVVAAIQSAHELERVGDLAQHIAEAARRRHPDSCVPEEAREVLVELSTQVGAMMSKAVTVLRTRNVILALELETDDDQVDALHRDLFTLMFGDEWNCGIPAAVDLTLLARFYERIADHAVSLAERTVYVVTGQQSGAFQL